MASVLAWTFDTLELISCSDVNVDCASGTTSLIGMGVGCAGEGEGSSPGAVPRLEAKPSVMSASELELRSASRAYERSWIISST